MVPHKRDEIEAAIARALTMLEAQNARDRVSTAKDENADRGAEGVAALDALRDAADALRGQLSQAEPPAEPNHRSPE